jgi:hypothetical protein
MAESDSKSPLAGVIGPAMILATISVLGYVTYEPSLKSARPLVGGDESVPSPPTPPGIGALHARLWDDPLVVAYQDSQKHKSKDNTALLQQDMHEVVKRFMPTVEGTEVGAGQHAKVLVMPVLVPGEPFGDDTEHRKRITYAVISALGVGGYELKYPDRLSYAQVSFRAFDAPTNRELDVDLTIPLKLFVAKTQGQEYVEKDPLHPAYVEVIVLWINESQLGSRPLAALRQILMGVFEKVPDDQRRTGVDLRIIGPRSSDSFIQMADEDLLIGAAPKDVRPAPLPPKQFASDFHDPRLLSATATACQEDFKDEQHAFMGGGISNSGLTVMRTIGTDSGLAYAIRQELDLRGAWPRYQGDGKYVVLVTESDTHYGRSIARAFRREFRNAVRASTDLEDGQLQVFTYLQGIDGKLNDRKKDEPDGDRPQTERAQADPVHAAVAEVDPASGRSQYDYLRRLENHLLEFHDEKRRLSGEGITAIGVVGTDVYDKLLVLRALRKKFPRVWFFTTDVDAELARTNEYPTTRNLLIASHFGLELNRHLQRKAPPFRDCYQTSSFLACLYALDDQRVRTAVEGAEANNFWLSESSPSHQSLSPLVFELGRSGPFQLTTTGTWPRLTASVQPHSPREIRWFGWSEAFGLGAIVFGMLGLLAIHSSRPRRLLGEGSLPQFCLRAAGMALLVCLLAFFIQWVHQQPDGEPFLVFEGISLWPPILIRLAAAVLGVLLLAAARRDLDLDPNPERIARSLLHDVDREAADDAAEDRAHSGRWLEFPGELVAFFGRFRVWVRDAWRGENHDASPFAVWRRGFTQMKTATQTIAEYCRDGGTSRRAARAVVIFASIYMFSTILFSLTDPPLQPYRGPVSQYVSKVVIYAASVIMIALTALVLDALGLCRALIRQLGHVEPDWPVSQTGTDPSRHVLTVRFIARRTHSVGKLTWYPLTLILLLVLARSKTFDLIDLSWPLLALWATIGALVILATLQFRRAASEARDAILNRLRDQMYGLHGQPRPKAAQERYQQVLERHQQVIDEIEREDAGAFRPFAQDPLFASLVLFFGGSGGIVLFDQLVPYL